MNRTDFIKMAALAPLVAVAPGVFAKDENTATHDKRHEGWLLLDDRRFKLLVTDEEAKWINDYFDKR